uniref:Uncharacterized protein n=1 Tax=Arundo donax TaxID=35708 RepID=A0A0A9C730_ARUDO
MIQHYEFKKLFRLHSLTHPKRPPKKR